MSALALAGDLLIQTLSTARAPTASRPSPKNLAPNSSPSAPLAPPAMDRIAIVQ
ncbi:hypothetical protein [Streptomyces sp. NPDC002172]